MPRKLATMTLEKPNERVHTYGPCTSILDFSGEAGHTTEQSISYSPGINCSERKRPRV